MASFEENCWQSEVLPSLPVGSLGFPKAKQQALANVLQKWAASCITEHLREINHGLLNNRWQIHWKGRDFLGAVRRQEVDVWVMDQEAGLVLAVDPKHFQSKDSLRKNWKNGHNDLVAFATNLHERYPLCAVGAVLSFPANAAGPSDLKQIHGICSRSIPRDRPANAPGKFEGFAVAVYDETGQLGWPFDKNSSRLRPENAFEDLARVIFERSIALVG